MADFLATHLGVNGNDQAASGATSPGAEWRDENDDGDTAARYRPRTYPYFKYLPYDTEDEAERQRNLDEIIKHLYIAIEAGDFAPGAVHWSRELRSWLGLKFDPPRKTRVKLVKLYYELAMAPGLDPSVAERFASMFMVLTKCVSCFPFVLGYSLFSSGPLACSLRFMYHLITMNAKIINKGENTICVLERTSRWIGDPSSRSSRYLSCLKIPDLSTPPQ
jgi:Proteasome-substrate-size regulator, N-terminal